MIICDDAGVAHRMFQRIREENPQLTPNIGGLLYGFLELLIAKDMHHLQELEEMAVAAGGTGIGGRSG